MRPVLAHFWQHCSKVQGLAQTWLHCPAPQVLQQRTATAMHAADQGAPSTADAPPQPAHGPPNTLDSVDKPDADGEEEKEDEEGCNAAECSTSSGPAGTASTGAEVGPQAFPSPCLHDQGGPSWVEGAECRLQGPQCSQVHEASSEMQSQGQAQQGCEPGEAEPSFELPPSSHDCEDQRQDSPALVCGGPSQQQHVTVQQQQEAEAHVQEEVEVDWESSGFRDHVWEAGVAMLQVGSSSVVLAMQHLTEPLWLSCWSCTGYWC
jgi:hypothetical protein